MLKESIKQLSQYQIAHKWKHCYTLSYMLVLKISRINQLRNFAKYTKSGKEIKVCINGGDVKCGKFCT